MYCIDIHSIASYSIFTVSVFVSLFFPFAVLRVDIFLFDVFQLFLRHFYLSIFSFSTFSVNSIRLTMAYELVHNIDLNLNHNETENKCNGLRARYTMTAKSMSANAHPQIACFSPYSIK